MYRAEFARIDNDAVPEAGAPFRDRVGGCRGLIRVIRVRITDQSSLATCHSHCSAHGTVTEHGLSTDRDIFKSCGRRGEQKVHPSGRKENQASHTRRPNPKDTLEEEQRC